MADRHSASLTYRARLSARRDVGDGQPYLGRADLARTFDRHGHLFLGAEHEARGLLDAEMERHGG
jgi:hypothetical protein